KLKDSPVCLAADAGGMDIRMERFLVENKQLPGISAKILEINPEHPIMCRLGEIAMTDGATEQFHEAALLLLDQARLVEGEEIRHPAAFARRISALMAKGLL